MPPIAIAIPSRAREASSIRSIGAARMAAPATPPSITPCAKPAAVGTTAAPSTSSTVA
jgi:hypothetical protein